MSETKTARARKRQLGQFLTPPALAAQLLERLPLLPTSRVLEPSMGDGSFVLPLIERFMELHSGSVPERLGTVLAHNVFGVELDPELYARCLDRIQDRWQCRLPRHNLVCADFFRHWFPASGNPSPLTHLLLDDRQRFDLVVGNPPFGGTIDPRIQDELDRAFGFRNGLKIKKETYSFFIVKCLELLNESGRLLFVCSDTFLTIPTMRGLRQLLMKEGLVRLTTLDSFSDETNHPMVILDFHRGISTDHIIADDRRIEYNAITRTGNSSWTIRPEQAHFFSGPTLQSYVVASSGMTIGANELFVRQIHRGAIIEPYEFEFFDDPIRLERELERARLGKLSPSKAAEVKRAEVSGETRRNVRWRSLAEPRIIELPHPDYRYYNKANSEIVFSKPTHAVFWKDEGDAVLTFKRNGNWYLHGVGGRPFFGREGITWQLISPRLNARYLPPGYILDSGSPCAFLRPDVNRNELYFILAWMLSPTCTSLLKGVLNHTRNIQSKDIERLPYPSWVQSEAKEVTIRAMRVLVTRAMAGAVISRDDPDMVTIRRQFEREASPIHEQ